MELRIFEDAEALAGAAAEEFVRIGRRSIEEAGRFTVALSGGSTPARLFRRLAAGEFRPRLAWDKIEFFWGDERPVPPEHPDSNYRLAHQLLLEPLGVVARNIHRMPAELADPAAAARAYQATIAGVFGGIGSGPPVFDLILLGMGADGHTASLFPGTAALLEAELWVAANPVPRLGQSRLTMTTPLINQAACVVFLVAGADKAEALAEVLEGQSAPQLYPAQAIRPRSGRLLWLVDRAAARRLHRPTSTTPAEDADQP